MDYEIETHVPNARSGSDFYKVRFRPSKGEPFHTNNFWMQDVVNFERNVEAYWGRKLEAADRGEPYPQFHKSTLNLQVGQSSDDAREVVANGNMSLTTASLDMGDHHVGLRFASVSGLRNTTISSALLTFRAAFASGVSFVGDWYGQDGTAAPGTFTTTTSDISNRTQTTATCEGDGSDFGNWTSGQDHTFNGPPGDPLTDIIQELADSYDPSAIVLIHIRDSGSGSRRAVSYDNDSSTAPKLDIDYHTPVDIPWELHYHRTRLYPENPHFT